MAVVMKYPARMPTALADQADQSKFHAAFPAAKSEAQSGAVEKAIRAQDRQQGENPDHLDFPLGWVAALARMAVLNIRMGKLTR